MDAKEKLNVLAVWDELVSAARKNITASEFNAARYAREDLEKWQRTIRALHLAAGMNPDNPNADALLGKVVRLAELAKDPA